MNEESRIKASACEKILNQKPRTVESIGKHGKRKFLLESNYKDELGRRPGIIPAGVPGMLAAAGGAGKSMMLMQLAFSVAGGGGWLTYNVKEPGKVLMLMGELEDCDFDERMSNILNSKPQSIPQKTLDNIIPICLGGYHEIDFVRDREDRIRNREKMQTPAYDSVLERLHKDGPYSLVIIDPASRFGGRDFELENAAATKLVQLLECLGASNGNPAIVLAHHTSKSSHKGKTDQTAARGSSALTDGMKWQINLERLERRERAPSLLVMRFVKTNYGIDHATLILSRNQDGLLGIASKDEKETYLNAKAVKEDSFFAKLKSRRKDDEKEASCMDEGDEGERSEFLSDILDD